MDRLSPPARRLAAILAAGALSVAGCSTSGGSGEGGDKTTTTAGGDETTTSTGGGPDDGPTTEDLEAILPAATDIGSGWTEDNAPDDVDENTSFEDQCPEVADLGLGDDDDSDKITQDYTDTEEHQLQVSLSPTAETLDQDDLEAFVDAINQCGTITDTNDQGVTSSFDLEAQADSDYGEQGIRLQADVTIKSDVFPRDLTLTLYSLSWREGTVGVQITAFDGIDDATFEAVPFDTDVLTDVADDLDAQVKDLVG